MLMLLLQATAPAEDFGWWDRMIHFFNTPAPYSPFSEYLVVMFVLWLIARYSNRKQTFDTQAQDVLDQKYAEGEISKSAYEKYRQQMILRPKR
jgi:hypothetical protein